MAASKKSTIAKVTEALSAEAVKPAAEAAKGKETAKAETPKAAAKTEAPKATAKTATKAVPAAEDKADTDKTTPAKETVKKPAKKPAAVKTEPAKPAAKKLAMKKELTSSIYVQYAEKSYSNEDLLKIAKDVWEYDLKNKVSDLLNVDLYVKPEENTVYYVFNGNIEGSFAI